MADVNARRAKKRVRRTCFVCPTRQKAGVVAPNQANFEDENYIIVHHERFYIGNIYVLVHVRSDRRDSCQIKLVSQIARKLHVGILIEKNNIQSSQKENRTIFLE